MIPTLSILICTMPDRKNFLARLMQILDRQRTPDTEIIVANSPHYSIGYKRNWLLDQAKGKYLDFIDDDDIVSDNNIELLMEGIDKGVDCCSLKGIITEDGQNPLLFEHSIKYTSYRTIADSVHGELRYERYPNHLNCIKASIAKQFRFPEGKHAHGDGNHGEDTSFAEQLFNSGLLKTEHYIPEVIYYYEYRSKK